MNSDFPIGLHIMGFLTARQGQPLTSGVLAETYGTGPVVVRRVLSRLQHAGLIETRRGLGGGSVLARPPAGITLREVYEAVSDDPHLLRRHPGKNHGVAQILGTYINDLCHQAEQALLDQLDAVTVQQMDAAVRPRILADCRKTKKK